MAKYEMDDSLGLFGGWREALDEQLTDIAEDHEAERDRLSSTMSLLPCTPLFMLRIVPQERRLGLLCSRSQHLR